MIETIRPGLKQNGSRFDQPPVSLVRRTASHGVLSPHSQTNAIQERFWRPTKQLIEEHRWFRRRTVTSQLLTLEEFDMDWSRVELPQKPEGERLTSEELHRAVNSFLTTIRER